MTHHRNPGVKPRKFNPKDLTAGDPVNTPKGPAEYVTYKENNFRNQNHQVRLANGQTHWYTDLQLRLWNRGEEDV